MFYRKIHKEKLHQNVNASNPTDCVMERQYQHVLNGFFMEFPIDDEPIIPCAAAAGFPIINVKIVGALQCPFQVHILAKQWNLDSRLEVYWIRKFQATR